MPKVQTVRLCYRLQDDDEWKVCTGDNELCVTIDDAGAKAKVEKIPAYTLENIDKVPWCLPAKDAWFIYPLQ